MNDSYTNVIVSTVAPSTPLDDHVDDFCFTLALALRKILQIDAVDAPTADETLEEILEVFDE